MENNTDPIEPVRKEKEKKGSKRIFFILLIAVLAIINGLLWWQNNQKIKEKEAVDIKLESTEKQKEQLEVQLNQRLAELEELKGKNTELDSIINERQEEIRKLSEDLDRKSRSGQLSASELKKARQQLADQEVKFTAEIEELKKRNTALAADLESTSQRLTVEKEYTTKLEGEKVILSQKVELGSVIKVSDLTAGAINVKGGNKEVPTKNSKRAEKLKVCFVADENRVAEPGNKDFLVRIIGPDGATMNVQSQGSGKFKMAESGEERPYSLKATVDYQNKDENVCVNWPKVTAFAEGVYTVEVYNSGYLVDKTTFELKSGLF